MTDILSDTTFLTGALIGCAIVCVLLFLLYVRKNLILRRYDKERVQFETWRGLKEAELDAQKSSLAESEALRIELLKQNERLKSDLELKENYFAEQVRFLEQNKEELSLKFQNISNEVIKAQNAYFNENQKTALGVLLKPFADQLSEFKQKMDCSHDDSVKFEEQLKSLMDLNQNLSKEAENLANALKGNKKIQGNWGEFQLERVLEISGLEKGINYICQETFKDENDKMLRPDVIVKLPNDRQVIIDSKVSLNDYIAFVNADNEIDKNAALKRHVACIKKHIDELSSKEYQKLLKDEALDYVMIFIPIEGAYVEAAKADTQLYDYAFSKNIAITTPSSLLPLLKTVESLWQLDKRNKNAAELAELGGKIYDKLAGFVADMEQIDKSITSAHTHYRDAMTKLSGKGGALSIAHQLKQKGAKTSKVIAPSADENNLTLIEERAVNE
ncbi:MAG: DNA recombination protein RmuC [Alphaproteobacteria bacterium]|nr:DNA recombination protein RmuC [Alphaproteobacteria bacterium]MBR6327364.1 DNA recombination protein RmuC [Alphaproteobacteria bacterium]